MATTMHRGRADVFLLRIARPLVCALAGTLFLILVATYIRGSLSIASTVARGPLIFSTTSGAASNANDQTLLRAIEATPLRQSLLNIAMVRAGGGAAATGDRWLAVLRRMGWRDTPASLNIITVLMERGDVDGVVEVFDALLRRGQRFAETAAALRGMEALPEGRAYVVRLLARHPSWRHDYLVTAGELQGPAQILGRYEVLTELQKRGDLVTREEIGPVLPLLIRGGGVSAAWKLWRGFAGAAGASSPISDADFRLAAGRADLQQLPIPFEWNFPTGEGFSTEVYAQGAAARLAISWSGQGAPVFASQQTSATPGKYGLTVVTENSGGSADNLITYRLRCLDNRIIEFQVTGSPQNGTQNYRASAPLECDFPFFEIIGKLQAFPKAQNITVSHVNLFNLSGLARK